MRRGLEGISAKIIGSIAIGASLYHLYIANFGTFESLKNRSIHLSWMLPLAFLLFPARQKSPRNRPSFFDILFAAIALASTTHVGIFAYDRIINRIEYIDPITVLDYVFGISLIILLIEAVRRCAGWGIVVVALISLSYIFIGKYLPGRIGYAGFHISKIVEHMYLTTEGIFSIPAGASANFIFIFIVFAAFLERSGVGQFFMEFSSAVSGRARGGPAKIAVIASGLQGMISGSAVANVVTTGSITIPMMKKLGYKPNFAGAVEAAASTGGQIMPPIMGAAAFIMAEFLGVSYTSIMKAAFLPAAMYFVAVGFMVHLEACKLGLEGLKKEQVPDIWKILRKKAHLAAPVLVIVTLLLLGYTAYKAAFYSIVSTLVVSQFSRETRMRFRDVVEALRMGAFNAVFIAIACTAAGLIIGSLSLTGLGMKFTGFVITLSAKNIFLTLILIAVTCIILGTGLPTAPAYIMAAAVASPILVEMGFDAFSANLFVLFYAIICVISPPVAMAAYAAAGVASSNAVTTGFIAMRLGIVAFIVPFFFIYNPAILLIGSFTDVVFTVTTCFLGTFALAIAMQGFLINRINFFERIIMLISGLIMLTHYFWANIVGIVIFGLIYFSHRGIKFKKKILFFEKK